MTHRITLGKLNWIQTSFLPAYISPPGVSLHCKMPAHLLSQEGGSAESQDKKNRHHHFMQSLFCGEADGCGATKHPDEQNQVNLFTAIPMPCKNQHCLCLPLGCEDKIWLFKEGPLQRVASKEEFHLLSKVSWFEQMSLVPAWTFWGGQTA